MNPFCKPTKQTQKKKEQTFNNLTNFYLIHKNHFIALQLPASSNLKGHSFRHTDVILL
jgi:hypothetical protein